MEITVAVDQNVPILTLQGRFDGYEATRFDEQVRHVASQSEFWILDFSGVPYLSSTGIRSLVTLEKALRSRSGGLILVGLLPFVKHVLETTGLLSRFRIAGTVPDALAAIPSRSDVTLARRTVNGRELVVRRLANAVSYIDAWKPIPFGEDADVPDEQLLTVTLDDLGFAFGVGGFGETRAQAAQALGQFIAAGVFAGVLPADGHAVSDFMIGSTHAELTVYLASGLSLAGSPAFVVEVSGERPFRIRDLVHDLFALASDATGAVPPVLGFVMKAEGAEAGAGALAIGIAVDEQAAGARRHAFEAVLASPGWHPLEHGRAAVGHCVQLHGAGPLPQATAEPLDAVRLLGNLELLRDLTSLDTEVSYTRAVIWAYVPAAVRNGIEKLLRIDLEPGAEWLDEWDAIARRLYRDCGRLVVTPLHGGFMSKTFRVVGYDREGRRMLPTVLKIGPTELTRREEQANRQYVERFVLNNSTTILGGAREGDWAGLRYNFLGVTGPESRLTWLREHCRRRPTAEVLALFETVYTRILKPWYGQPKWEQVALYADHTPFRLFPRVLEDAERELGIAADVRAIRCEELGLDLPNPFHFLKYEYPRRHLQSRLWYTSICHGDLNLQNILVDERENVYVIDFSETKPRNIVSDFARVEPIVKFELVRLEHENDLKALLEFEVGLTSVTRLDQRPPLTYSGSDPMVEKGYHLICQMRRYADTVTLFETDLIPYWLAVLEWTYSVVSYGSASRLQKLYAAYSAALICRSIQQQEAVT